MNFGWVNVDRLWNSFFFFFFDVDRFVVGFNGIVMISAFYCNLRSWFHFGLIDFDILLLIS